MYVKQEFTRFYLAPLLRKLNGNIWDVIYKKDDNTNEEYIHITYRLEDKLGDYQELTKIICVTEYSSKEITEVVLKKAL